MPKHYHTTIPGNRWSLTPALGDALAVRIWEDYKTRIERVLKPLPLFRREEILLEIQSHIWESIEHDTDASEAEKVLNAVQKLGQPEVYLQPIVGLKLLESAAHSFSPNVVAKSLLYMIGGSRVQSALVIVMSILYTVLFVLALMVCAKFFFPQNIGLFQPLSGDDYLFGFITSETPLQDVLGYWFIPLGLLICGILYALITNIAYRIVRTIVHTTIIIHEES